MYKKVILIFSFFGLLLFTNAADALEKKTVTSSDSTPEVWMTIFVHGIMSVKHHLSLNNIMNFINDQVENTEYALTVMHMRENPFFYQNQAMQELGLKKINLDSLAPGNASAALANIMDDVLKTAHGSSLCNHFYTFGWSGLLSPSVRYAEAKKLFGDIEQEIQKFKEQGITPHIRVIGFSHGGNLSLNLAAVKQQENATHQFSIDQLVLLGVPIQYDNDYFVADSLFKQVYHFYSPGDRVQQLDLFSGGNFFSSRTFKERKNFKLPEKLTQVCVTMKRPMHLYNNTKGTTVQLRKIDPGHTELWLFGWTPAHYRTYSPLYPLPIVALTPSIISHIEQEKPTLQPVDNILTVDLRPHEETAIFKASRKKQIAKKILPDGMLAQLKEKALQAKPHSYTKIEYKQHIEMARQKAQKSNLAEITHITAKDAKNPQISSAEHVT